MNLPDHSPRGRLCGPRAAVLSVGARWLDSGHPSRERLGLLAPPPESRWPRCSSWGGKVLTGYLARGLCGDSDNRCAGGGSGPRGSRKHDRGGRWCVPGQAPRRRRTRSSGRRRRAVAFIAASAVSCAVSATFGSAALRAWGLVGSAELLVHWVTWLAWRSRGHRGPGASRAGFRRSDPGASRRVCRRCGRGRCSRPWQ